MIPILVSEGYNWVVVPNSHRARTCQNYMDGASKGAGGWSIDPPNKAVAGSTPHSPRAGERLK